MDMGSGSEPTSDSLNGLKFGKKIYFEDVGSGSGGSGGNLSKQLAEPPAKKGKGVVQVGIQQQQQPPRCQVEGCNLDLTGAKAYYCRHKVCGMHSKSPKVVVSGIEQRFCQQCSRFHQLNEFDQGKRSCRRRLAGHNERRRKPPSGPLSPSLHEDSGKFRSFLVDFTYPRPPATLRDLWPTVRASDHHEAMAHPYMQSSANFTAHELPQSECLGGFTDSSCALSLLSNQQPWGGSADPRNRGPAISATGPSNQHTTGTGDYVTSTWGFKGQGSGSSLEAQHDMEFGHFDNGNDQFAGELELALQGNRQYQNHGPAQSYDNSGSGMHWSP